MFSNGPTPKLKKIRKRAVIPKIGGVWIFEGASLTKLPDYFHDEKAVTVCISSCGKYWYGTVGMANVKVGGNLPFASLDDNKNPVYIRIDDLQDSDIWEEIRRALRHNKLGPATSGFHPSVNQKCYCDKQQLMINGCVSAKGKVCPNTPKELL